jgi:hypothetical protein
MLALSLVSNALDWAAMFELRRHLKASKLHGWLCFSLVCMDVRKCAVHYFAQLPFSSLQDLCNVLLFTGWREMSTIV